MGGMTRIGSKVETIVLKAEQYARSARAPRTWEAYASDWKVFSRWCSERNVCPLPAATATVAAYLIEMAPMRKIATLQRHMAAIAVTHKHAGFESPCNMAKSPELAELWRGIRRQHGAPQTQKKPVLVTTLRSMVEQTPQTVAGIRDRAVLLLGFAGAFRRSELAALTVADLSFTDAGCVVLLRRSKTDQEGAGRQVGIPYGSNPQTCPVRTVRAWLNGSRLTAGPLFRPVDRHGNVSKKPLSNRAIAGIVKARAAAIGLDPSGYSGHSLRAGLATSAAEAGVSEWSIMAQTGHRSTTMVRRYIRSGELFHRNAAAAVGL